MLFYVVCLWRCRLWEPILCVCDMCAVMLKHKISAPISVQHTLHFACNV